MCRLETVSNSFSTKGKKIIPLKNYIVSKIDKNQNIKRLCFYLTKTPLLDRSIDNNNNLIYQRDIPSNVSLQKDNKIYVGKDINDKTKFIQAKKTLIPYAYNPDMPTETQVFIFVHNDINDFNSFYGDNIIGVEILVPYEYDILEPYSEQRLYKIVNEIIDMFDNVLIDKEYRDQLGDIELEIVGRSKEQRLSKTDKIIVYPLSIRAKTANTRVLGNEKEW